MVAAAGQWVWRAMNPPSLLLRDVHEPLAPPWWPLAPGWWCVLAVLLLALALVAWWYGRRRLRRRRAARLFDAHVAAASTPAAQVAAMSELLRRAARRVDPDADRLEGDGWLRLLDRGWARPVFSEGPGALLRDGAFRPSVDADDVAALRVVARARFLAWMEAR